MALKIPTPDCWLCCQPLPVEEHLTRLDELGFTVHNACFALAAEKKKQTGIAPKEPARPKTRDLFFWLRFEQN